MIRISFFSPHRSFIGFEIRKGLEPMEIDNRLFIQRNVIISMGFMFGYIDITFNYGNPAPIEETLSEFEPVPDRTDMNS